jgi:hypothetical protein
MQDWSIERLKREKRIWIYGIGRIGKKLCDMFEVCEIKLDKILVTDYNNNPKRFHGIPVEEFREIATCENDKNALVVITPIDTAQKKIIKELEENGYYHYIEWSVNALSSFWSSFPHYYQNRQMKKDKVIFVLCGYKRYLWKYTLERLKRYLPNDVEVCLCSSGILDKTLMKIADKNNWSYLSTEINSVTLIQNIAYSVYSDYHWIYKMDEDIFLTYQSLDKLFSAYARAENTLPYHIGIVAPLIPLNEYGYRFILEKYNCLDDFERRFGKAYFGGDGKIIQTVEIAPYLWGANGNLPKIDKMMADIEVGLDSDKDAGANTGEFSVCSTRYNIGLIFFNRQFWENMIGLTVNGSKDIGADEIEICAYCMTYSKPIIVAHQIVVGHFAFGLQEERMRNLLQNSPRLFQ